MPRNDACRRRRRNERHEGDAAVCHTPHISSRAELIPSWAVKTKQPDKTQGACFRLTACATRQKQEGVPLSEYFCASHVAPDTDVPAANPTEGARGDRAPLLRGHPERTGVPPPRKPSCVHTDPTKGIRHDGIVQRVPPPLLPPPPLKTRTPPRPSRPLEAPRICGYGSSGGRRTEYGEPVSTPLEGQVFSLNFAPSGPAVPAPLALAVGAISLPDRGRELSPQRRRPTRRPGLRPGLCHCVPFSTSN